MATVLIAGGSGLIGSHLSGMLKDEGHHIKWLSRSGSRDSIYPSFKWNINEQTYDAEAFVGVDYIINLAGAAVVGPRWTLKRKEIIMHSRTASNDLIRKALSETGLRPKAYISGSAIGYYGDSGEVECDESSLPSDNGFLSTSVQAWEKAIARIHDEAQIPTLIVRIGIVLSAQGGALPQMLLPLKMGASTYFGAGKQWYSWIHIDDVCRIFMKGITDHEFRGVVNGVAPCPVRNKRLAKVLQETAGHFSLLLPVPSTVLQLMMGEMSHVVLDSCKVSSSVLDAVGFEFTFSELEAALVDIQQRKV